MRIISLNANGIRSGGTPGFFQWADSEVADVICLQETRAQDASAAARGDNAGRIYAVFSSTRAAAATAVSPLYSRRGAALRAAFAGLDDMDSEGRFVQADFGAVTVRRCTCLRASAVPRGRPSR